MSFNSQQVAQDIRQGEAFREVSFAGMDFSGQDLSGGMFEKVDFSGVVFNQANLQEAVFIQCNFERAVFNGSNLYKTTFQGALRDECRFIQADCNEKKSWWWSLRCGSACSRHRFSVW